MNEAIVFYSSSINLIKDKLEIIYMKPMFVLSQSDEMGVRGRFQCVSAQYPRIVTIL